jgi:predicted RNase H-like HicB family nuclease
MICRDNFYTINRNAMKNSKVHKRQVRNRQFTVIVERDQEGWYVGSVTELPGCHTQARSLDTLMKRIREAIELCLEVKSNSHPSTEFVGVQRIAV